MENANQLATKADLNVISTQVQSLHDDVQVLQNDVDVLKNDVLSLKGDVDLLSADVHVLKVNMEVATKGIESLKTEVLVVKDGMRAFEKRMVAQFNQQWEMDQRLLVMLGKLESKLGHALDDHGQRLEVIEAKLELRAA